MHFAQKVEVNDATKVGVTIHGELRCGRDAIVECSAVVW